MIIGVVGYTGAGKDYAAKMLRDELLADYSKIYKLAAPLKEFVAKVEGITLSELEAYSREPNSRLRQMLQELGTEWGRRHNEAMWVEHWWRQYMYDCSGVEISQPGIGGFAASWIVQDTPSHAIVADVRFPNEVQFLNNHSGVTIFLESHSSGSDHPSETDVALSRDLCRECIPNQQGGRTPEGLRAALRGVCEKYKIRTKHARAIPGSGDAPK